MQFKRTMWKYAAIRPSGPALLSFVVFVGFFAGVGVAQAQTTRLVSPQGEDVDGCGTVDVPCRTIHRGLEIASAGDTLSLAAGVYFESGLVIGTDITIVGEGSSSTIIDGDGVEGTRTYFLASVEEAVIEARRVSHLTAGKSGSTREAYAGAVESAVTHLQREYYGTSSSANSGYVVFIEAGVTAELVGVTIRDGGGFTSSSTSGGIVNSGSLVVRESVLEHNVSFHSDLDSPDATGRGGAILNFKSLTVDETVIRRNFAVGFALSGGTGGGIFNEGDLTVVGSTVESNEAWDAQDFCKGGGIANVGSAKISASRIVGNSSNCFEGGAGGGLYSSGSLVIERTAVARNSARSRWEYSAGQGGGIASYGDLEILNSTVSENASGMGGGIYVSGPTIAAGVTIIANRAEDRPYTAGEGGGLYADDGSLLLWSSVVAGNTAGEDGFDASADCRFSSSDFELGFALSGESTGCTGATLTVEAETALESLFGDISGDTFAFTPEAGSPLVDAGDCHLPGRGPLAFDQLGNERPFDDESVENVSDGCDIGAVETQISTEQSSDQLAASAEEATQFDLALGQNYPNPFSGSTRIEFTVPATQNARIVVYDLMGREVARLVDGTLTRGHHNVDWNAEEAANGVYLCRLTVGGASEVRQLTLSR